MASSSTTKRALSDGAVDVDVAETNAEANAGTSSTSSHQPTQAGAVKKKKKRKAAPTPGVVYISRLPPGMTPHKVRHLMARWGEVGKVYAQRRDAPTGYDPSARKKKEKHRAANFSEAWVEFLDKSVAKTVASMLNAEAIGGRPGDRWRDDIWTMKYLSGFRWEMLGEQVAYERQAHQSRLRAEIAKSKTEQGEYLKNVELARVLDKRRAKKGGGGELVQHRQVDNGTNIGHSASTNTNTNTGTGHSATGTNTNTGIDHNDAKAEIEGKQPKKTYKQRQVVDKAHGLQDARMDSVLGSVFG